MRPRDVQVGDVVTFEQGYGATCPVDVTALYVRHGGIYIVIHFIQADGSKYHRLLSDINWPTKISRCIMRIAREGAVIYERDGAQ